MKGFFDMSDLSVVSRATLAAESAISASRGAADSIRPRPLRSLAGDYLELSKFRLSLLVLVVTGAGYCFAAGSSFDSARLAVVIVGTGLVAFAANAANQVIERRFDQLMRRTMDRPVAAGRISPPKAAVFAAAAAIGGFAALYAGVNAWAAWLALSTLGLYLLVYTPLKRVTPLNTLAGAVPGAIPPMIGVAAAGGGLTADAWLLFAILFFWQLPHFFAIAWLYREDYARGGYKMLSVVDATGAGLSRQTVLFTVALILASLAPAFVQRSGMFYMLGAAVLGYGMLICAGRFALDRGRPAARTLLLASIAYLPLLMALLLADRMLG